MTRPAETNPSDGPGRGRVLALLGLIAIVVFAVYLRARDLDLTRLGPDDGSYLYSAKIHELHADADRGSLGDDFAWLGETHYYPHSRLHQLVQRWWYRAGADATAAARLNSVVFGALTAGLLGALYLIARPSRWRAGLFGALILASQVLFVWYGRSGWGQTACTFAWMLYFLIGWRFLSAPTSIGQRVLLGLGLAITGFAAYGFHEMAVVHVVGLGVVVTLLPSLVADEPWSRRLLGLPKRALTDSRTWIWLVASLPVLWFLYRLFSDPFAQQHWLDVNPEDKPGFWAIKKQNLEFLFDTIRVYEQLSLVVVGLSILGAIVVARRDRFLFTYGALWFAVSTLPFLLFFKDAGLVRIYLPAMVVMAMFAGEAVDWACTLLAEKVRLAAFAGICVAFGAWATFVTFGTIFGQEGDAGFIRVFHAPDAYDVRPHHRPHDEMLDIIRDTLEPGEKVAVQARPFPGGPRGDFSPLFLLMDEGIPAEVFVFEGRFTKIPQLVVGVRSIFESGKLLTTQGGYYRQVWVDAFDRHALYELEIRKH